MHSWASQTTFVCDVQKEVYAHSAKFIPHSAEAATEMHLRGGRAGGV